MEGKPFLMLENGPSRVTRRYQLVSPPSCGCSGKMIIILVAELKIKLKLFLFSFFGK
jgi:hypothetical protein